MAKKFYDLIKIREAGEWKHLSCGNKIRYAIHYVLQRNDLQVFPMLALIYYTGRMLSILAKKDYHDCKNVMNDWVVLEIYIYFCNIFGLGVYLFIKAIVNRFGKKDRIVISSYDERCMRLTDTLSRNLWDCFACQIAVNNLMVSFFVSEIWLESSKPQIYLDMVCSILQLLMVM